MNATYISGNSFSVTGNLTTEFVVGRRVKLDCGLDGIKYATVASGTYSGPDTTVYIDENDLTANLVDALYGIVQPGSEGSLPNHSHDSVEGNGGLISVSGTDDHTHTAYVPWNFGSGTISGTGDIYCNDIHTSSGTVYIGNLKLSTDGTNLLVNDVVISGTVGSDGNRWHFGAGVPSNELVGNYDDFYLDDVSYNVYHKGTYSGITPEATKYNTTGMTHAANGFTDQTSVSDDNISTYSQSIGTISGSWISIDMATPIQVIEFASAGHTSYANRMVKDFIIQGSNDNIEWTDVYTDTAPGVSYTTYSFGSASAHYRYWRVYTLNNYGHLSYVLVTRYEFFRLDETQSSPIWASPIGNLKGAGGIDGVDGTNTSTTFSGLSDTPANYGTPGYVLTSTGSGTVWSTVSGSGGISNLVEDTTPELGGNLFTAAYTISGTGDIYCNEIFTSSGTVWIGNLKLSTDGANLLINDTTFSGGVGPAGPEGPPGADGVGGSTTFSGLSDTPGSYDNGKYLRSTASGVEWVDIFVPAFIDLTDTPTSYSGVGTAADLQTKFLLQSDTTDGSTAFIDSSLFSQLINVFGNTSHSVTEKKIGPTSIYFSGTTDYITVTDSTDWDFVGNDFCIEYWINPSKWNNYFFGWYNGAWFNYSRVSIIQFISPSGYLNIKIGGPNDELVSTSTITIGSWTHIAVTRQGDAFRLFINGTQQDSFTSSTSINNLSVPLYVGAMGYDGQPTGEYLQGYIDEIRIINGRSEYISNFTPPITHFSVEASYRTQILTINQDQTELIFQELPDTFIELTDTPVDYGTANQIFTSTGSGTVWSTPLSGPTTFSGLSDTPDNYTDGNYLRMTAAGITTVSGIILEAPNGSEWLLQVTNSGTLYTTEVI